MLITPIAISQGMSFFFTRSNLGRMIKMPTSNIREDIKSLQNAKPTAENPLFSMILKMKIPEVPQQAVAIRTRNIPDNLDGGGF